MIPEPTAPPPRGRHGIVRRIILGVLAAQLLALGIGLSGAAMLRNFVAPRIIADFETITGALRR